MSQEKNHSDVCWVVKAAAILFVITAHTDFSLISNPFLKMVLSRLGSVAVPLFFVLAGYFFRVEKIASFGELVKKKAAGVCVPWLFCGVLVYGYTALRGFAELSVGPAVRFLLGNGSYLYYLPVLLLLQSLFYFLRDLSKNGLLWSSLVITVLSLSLSAAGLAEPVLSRVYLTSYLNLFNWCAFFAIGYAAQEVTPEALFHGIKRLWVLAATLWVLMLCVGFFIESSFGYFSWLGFPMELCSSILMLRLGIALADSKWLCRLGKYSFAIYLLHFPFVPIVAKFFGNHSVGVLFSPVLTYAVTFAATWIIWKLASILKCAKLATRLLGVR